MCWCVCSFVCFVLICLLLQVILLWVAFRVCESSDAHMGYDLPWSIFR